MNAESAKEFLELETQLQNSQADLWRVFRIMAEFVEGFETMASIKPSIAIFGSARTKPEDKYYKTYGKCCRRTC